MQIIPCGNNNCNNSVHLEPVESLDLSYVWYMHDIWHLSSYICHISIIWHEFIFQQNSCYYPFRWVYSIQPSFQSSNTHNESLHSWWYFPTKLMFLSYRVGIRHPSKLPIHAISLYMRGDYFLKSYTVLKSALVYDKYK